MEEFGTKVEAAYKATESADKTPEQADDIKACQTWESAELANMSSLVKKCGISNQNQAGARTASNGNQNAQTCQSECPNIASAPRKWRWSHTEQAMAMCASA